MNQLVETMLGYSDQYQRTKRWYDRFCKLAQGRTHDLESVNYVDDIYAFFMNCYHLKDWLKNDRNIVASIRNAVEPYINSDESLCLCADICNSLKHFDLPRSPRSQADPAFGAKRYAIALEPGKETIISLKLEVTTRDGPIDAFQLATNCVVAWEKFLDTHHLPK